MKTLLTIYTLIGLCAGMLQAQQAPAEQEPDPADLANPLADFSNKPAAPAAAAAAEKLDPDLPQPFDPALVTNSMKASPFNRAVNLSESLVLTGIAHIEGKTLATLLDKETKRTYVVTDEPNSQGWRLEEAKPTLSLKFSQVKVNIGGELVTIRHDVEAQDDAMKKHKVSPGGNSGGSNGGGDSKGFQRDRRGPPPEVVERYNKLSDDAKGKLRKHFEENKERLMNMSQDDRRTFMEKSFKKIAEEDEGKRK